jgi:hypothetical protein
VSAEPIHVRLIWLQLAAVVESPDGIDGAVRSKVVDVVDPTAVVVVVAGTRVVVGLTVVEVDVVVGTAVVVVATQLGVIPDALMLRDDSLPALSTADTW